MAADMIKGNTGRIIKPINISFKEKLYSFSRNFLSCFDEIQYQVSDEKTSFIKIDERTNKEGETLSLLRNRDFKTASYKNRDC